MVLKMLLTYITEQTFLDTHNGLPVTRIGNYAFYDRPNLRSITIPNSVTSIGTLAFFACSNLSIVTLGNSITSIEYGAFQICYRLTSITLPAKLTDIGKYGFLDCVNLVEIQNNSELPIEAGSSDYGYIANFALHVYKEGESRLTYTDDFYTFYHDDNVSYLQGYWGLDTDLVFPSSFIAYDGTTVNQYVIYQYSFYYPAKLTSVTIPSSVTSIEYRAFWNCISINTVIMSNSVAFVNYGAFGGSNIKDVYYGGTQEEWNAIEFGVDTYELQDATIYYYSETEPTTSGYYWHYDTDGITPIVW